MKMSTSVVDIMQTLFETISAVVEILNFTAERIEILVLEKLPLQEQLSTTSFDMFPCPKVCRHWDRN